MGTVVLSELAAGPYGRPDLEEFRAQALRPLLWSPFGLATLSIVGVYDVDRPELSWLPAILAATVGLLASRAARYGVVPAAVALLVGLGLTLAVAQFLYPGSPFAVLYVLLVVASAAILGPPAGLAAAVPASVAILGLRLFGDEALPPLVANTALFAVGTAAGISWLATSPFRTALDWLWSSYAQLVAMS
ncbi:MAG: hypothetical protein HYY04_05475, partial [Chloroflexi bacterium]|nr:hypothetical protein [Chloroflexota bacterium]